jgi:hypothetical protein
MRFWDTVHILDYKNKNKIHEKGADGRERGCNWYLRVAAQNLLRPKKGGITRSAASQD